MCVCVCVCVCVTVYDCVYVCVLGLGKRWQWSMCGGHGRGALGWRAGAGVGGPCLRLTDAVCVCVCVGGGAGRRAAVSIRRRCRTCIARAATHLAFLSPVLRRSPPATCSPAQSPAAVLRHPNTRTRSWSFAPYHTHSLRRSAFPLALQTPKPQDPLRSTLTGGNSSWQRRC